MRNIELKWLKKAPFKRVRITTLYRLALLFEADVISGRANNNVSEFMLWLEKYMEASEES